MIERTQAAAPPVMLTTVSARIGKEPTLVQGAGGNTSEKVDRDGRRVMWIKASGTWLATAEVEPIFVCLDLDRACSASRAGEERVPEEAIVDGPSGLRPSIETSLHLALPQSCVAHYHSIQAIAWAARQDAQVELDRRLSGLSWQWVPYVRPGLPLTRSLETIIDAQKAPSLLVLANHGVVVAADDWTAVERLIADIEDRLALAPRLSSGYSHSADKRPAAPEGWRWIASRELDALARDATARNLAAMGSYYPDHVIFLGHAAWVGELEDLARVTDRDRSKLAIIPDLGCLLADTAARGADAMAEALARFLLCVPPEARLVPLSEADEAALLGWEAEKYRQRLAVERR